MATAKKSGSSKAATATSKEKSLTELVDAFAAKTGLPKAKAREVLDAHAELVIDELKTNGKVQLPGIGKLSLGDRPEREGRNPATGEPMTIKASKTVKFSGGKKFKESFNS